MAQALLRAFPKEEVMRLTKFFSMVMLLGLNNMVFGGSPVFTITDSKDDALSITNNTVAQSDLDLVSLSAETRNEKTTFKATFAKPIDVPDQRVISQSGATLESIATNGFYTFNLDVYIDTNGRMNDVSRKGIKPEFAWEKVICVNPRPNYARMALQEEMKRLALNEIISQKGHYTAADEKEVDKKVKQQIEEQIYFPTLISVHGSTLEFVVPNSFFQADAESQWTYAAGVTASALLNYINQTGSSTTLAAEYNDVLNLPSLMVEENLLKQTRTAYVDMILPPESEGRDK
jgi:hypothetical protein